MIDPILWGSGKIESTPSGHFAKLLGGDRADKEHTGKLFLLFNIYHYFPFLIYLFWY